MKRALLLLAACRAHATPDAPHGAEVQVLVAAPGLTAEQLEQRAVIPIERQRSPIARHVRSFAVDGHAVITFELADRVDVYAGREAVLTWVQAADLRDPITTALSPATQRDGAIARYTLRSDRVSIADVRSWQDWTAEQQFLRIPGVAGVATCGGRERRIEVDVDSVQALALVHAYAAGDVANAITRALTDSHVTGRGQVTVDDLGMLVVVARPEGIVRIRDIAAIRLDSGLPDCLAVDERGQAVVGVVLGRSGTKPIDVRHAIEPTLASLGGAAPAGTELRVWPIQRPITLAVASTSRGADLGELSALRDVIKPVAGVDRMIAQRGIDDGFVAGFGDEIAIRIVPVKDADRGEVERAVRAALAAHRHIAFGDDARVVELLGGSPEQLAAITAALAARPSIHIVGEIGATVSVPSPSQDREIDGGRIGETAIPIIVHGDAMPMLPLPPARQLVERDDDVRWVGVRVIAADDELADAVAKLQLPAGTEIRVARGR